MELDPISIFELVKNNMINVNLTRVDFRRYSETLIIWSNILCTQFWYADMYLENKISLFILFGHHQSDNIQYSTYKHFKVLVENAQQS